MQKWRSVDTGRWPKNEDRLRKPLQEECSPVTHLRLVSGTLRRHYGEELSCADL